MKKSVSKFTCAGFICLSLLAGASAVSADGPPAAIPDAAPAKPKRLSASTHAAKDRKTKVDKPMRLSKKLRELTDVYAEAAPLEGGTFGLTPASAEGPEDAGSTSGTLATETSTNYSTAPWAITAGTGTAPGGGGTAEFDAVTNLTATVPGTTTITLDVTPTLAGITFDSPFNYTLAASGTNTLAPPPRRAGRSPPRDTPASTPTLFSFGDVISAPISGGGTTGLTVTGGGIVDLTAINTYTGGTVVNDGSTLVLSTREGHGARHIRRGATT